MSKQPRDLNFFVQNYPECKKTLQQVELLDALCRTLPSLLNTELSTVLDVSPRHAILNILLFALSNSWAYAEGQRDLPSKKITGDNAKALVWQSFNHYFNEQGDIKYGSTCFFNSVCLEKNPTDLPPIFTKQTAPYISQSSQKTLNQIFDCGGVSPIIYRTMDFLNVRFLTQNRNIYGEGCHDKLFECLYDYLNMMRFFISCAVIFDLCEMDSKTICPEDLLLSAMAILSGGKNFFSKNEAQQCQVFLPLPKTSSSDGDEASVLTKPGL